MSVWARVGLDQLAGDSSLVELHRFASASFNVRPSKRSEGAGEHRPRAMVVPNEAGSVGGTGGMVIVLFTTWFEKRVMVIVDGAYGKKPFLSRMWKAGAVVVSRLRKDAALFDLPYPLARKAGKS
jgi:hypothetical protein